MDGASEDLQAVIDAQKGLTRYEIGQEEYDALKSAYDAFMAKLTEVIDGIEEVSAKVNATGITHYDVHGRLIAKPQKGINIIRKSDGTTRKVMVK